MAHGTQRVEHVCVQDWIDRFQHALSPGIKHDEVSAANCRVGKAASVPTIVNVIRGWAIGGHGASAPLPTLLIRLLGQVRTCGRPKSGAAVSWPISMMPRRMARVRVKCSNSASPSLRRIARVSSKILVEGAEHLQHRFLVGEEHVAPHRRIGGGDAGEVAKAAGGELDHFRRCHLLEFVGGADDGVGDQMRQVAGDREHQIVMVGVMISTRAPSAGPERAQLSTAAGSVPSGGVRMHQRLMKSSAKPESGPECSVPATGCAGTK